MVMILCTKSCPPHVTPGTVDRQIPLSMGFSRKECCSGLPLTSLGARPPTQGSNLHPSLTLAGGFFMFCATWGAQRSQRTCVHICVYTHTHTHTHIYIHTHTQFVCVSYTNTVEHSCIYICIYTHTYLWNVRIHGILVHL